MSDLARMLTAATRSRFQAALQYERLAPDGRGSTTHLLAVDSPLVWSYGVLDAAGTPLRSVSCDGDKLRTQEAQAQSVVPVPERFDPLDEPMSFYTWTRIGDTRVVEMLRPFDVLALAEVLTVEERTGEILVHARPNWREPSPYNGISLPGTASFRLLVDPARSVLSWATAHEDEAGASAPTDRWQLLDLVVGAPRSPGR